MEQKWLLYIHLSRNTRFTRIQLSGSFMVFLKISSDQVMVGYHEEWRMNCPFRSFTWYRRDRYLQHQATDAQPCRVTWITNFVGFEKVITKNFQLSEHESYKVYLTCSLVSHSCTQCIHSGAIRNQIIATNL